MDFRLFTEWHNLDNAVSPLRATGITLSHRCTQLANHPNPATPEHCTAGHRDWIAAFLRSSGVAAQASACQEDERERRRGQKVARILTIFKWFGYSCTEHFLIPRFSKHSTSSRNTDSGRCCEGTNGYNCSAGRTRALSQETRLFKARSTLSLRRTLKCSINTSNSPATTTRG